MKMKTWKQAYDPSLKRSADGTNCGGEELTSLQGAPSIVKGDFLCDGNKLTSLEGAPTYVGAYFYCSDNRLTSLKGVPRHIGGFFDCNNNKLTSLRDIHLQIDHIGESADFSNNRIKSHVLGVLLIDGLKEVQLDNKRVQIILNKHLPSKGMESVFEAQEELILAGLEEYAQL